MLIAALAALADVVYADSDDNDVADAGAGAEVKANADAGAFFCGILTQCF